MNGQKVCSKSRKQVRPKFYFYSVWMGTKMEIGGEAMHLRSRDLWYEGHATLCTKRRPPLAMPPLLEIANVKLATLSHWQHSQPPALRQSKSRYLTNRSITPLNFTLFLRYHPKSSTVKPLGGIEASVMPPLRFPAPFTYFYSS